MESSKIKSMSTPTNPAAGSQADLLAQLPEDLREKVKEYQEKYKILAKESEVRDMVITMNLHEFLKGCAFASNFLTKGVAEVTTTGI
jgi:hypothetical protein